MRPPGRTAGSIPLLPGVAPADDEITQQGRFGTRGEGIFSALRKTPRTAENACGGRQDVLTLYRRIEVRAQVERARATCRRIATTLRASVDADIVSHSHRVIYNSTVAMDRMRQAALHPRGGTM